MRTRTKVWLIIATALMLLGGILFAVIMTRLDWDFMKLSTVKYETNTHEVGDTFDSISIHTDTADILFALSDDGRCRVTCYEDESANHSVTVENNTLVVKHNPRKAWHSYIGFSFDSPKITVSLPKAEYASILICEDTGDVEIPEVFAFKNADISVSTGDVSFLASATETVNIKTSTGDICVEKLSVGSLELSVSTGRVTASDVTSAGGVSVDVSTGKAYLTDITCQSLTSSGSTGDISLNNVIVSESLSIKRSTGDVSLGSCDAAEIFVKTNTGDVRGSLLSDKMFLVTTDTGKTDIPQSTTGGKCEITTDTGDIKITIN